MALVRAGRHIEAVNALCVPEDALKINLSDDELRRGTLSTETMRRYNTQSRFSSFVSCELLFSHHDYVFLQNPIGKFSLCRL